MGVDYYACENCNKTFPDAGEYEMCGCGRNWCNEKCASKHGLRVPELLDEYGDVEEYDYDEATCQFCREEEFDDEVLLSHLLHVMDMTREELIEGYKKWESITNG